MAGSSYSSTQLRRMDFLDPLAGNINAKEGTYYHLGNTPSNPTDWKDFFAVEYNNDSNYNLRFQADNAAPSHVELKVDWRVQRHAYLSDANDDLSGWNMLTLVIKDGYASCLY